MNDTTRTSIALAWANGIIFLIELLGIAGGGIFVYEDREHLSLFYIQTGIALLGILSSRGKTNDERTRFHIRVSRVLHYAVIAAWMVTALEYLAILFVGNFIW